MRLLVPFGTRPGIVELAPDVEVLHTPGTALLEPAEPDCVDQEPPC